MTFQLFRERLSADFRRNYDCSLGRFFLTDFFFPNYKFRFIVWLRLCEFLVESKCWKILYPFAAIMYHRYSLKSDMEICFGSVEEGVKIQHSAGFIIIHSEARVGKRVQLSPGVIIGISSLKRKHDLPIIGDDCYLAPNAQIFGKCKIGNNVIIGTDSVLRDQDIPDGAVVVGNPARIIQQK